MKNLIVIGSYDSGTKNNPAVLAEGLKSEEVTSRVIYWEDLTLKIDSQEVRILINDEDPFDETVDLVIAVGWYKRDRKLVYRDLAYSVAKVLDSRGIKYWNSEMGNQRSTTKLSTMVELALHGVSVPSTMFSLNSANLLNKFEPPFIIKAIAASRGESNYLVDEEFDSNLVSEARGYFLAQPFLPNSHDLRFICVGGKVVEVLRRSRADNASTHLNNTSQGGESEWVNKDEINPQLLTIVEKISRIMKRELAGVDMIPDDSSPYQYSCLEVNAIPQLTSGVDVEKKLNAIKKALKTD